MGTNEIIEEKTEDERTDVRRMVDFKRGQIYICTLDDYRVTQSEEHLFSKTGLIGKSRPCMIWSNDDYNKDSRNTYTIIPIKSNHTSLSTKQYIQESYDILVPIWINGVEKFLAVSQARPINAVNIRSYMGTITNQEILDEVDKAFLVNHMRDKDIMEQIFYKYGNVENIIEFLNSNKAYNCYLNYVKRGKQ